MVDKQLVKHLQKEVSRLKAELMSPEPSSSECFKSLLLEKEQRISRWREMNEIKRERDLAQSQHEVMRKLQDDRPSGQAVKRLSFGSEKVSIGSEKKTQRRGIERAVRKKLQNQMEEIMKLFDDF